MSTFLKSLVLLTLVFIALSTSLTLTVEAQDNHCSPYRFEEVAQQWTLVDGGLERRIDAPYGTDALLRVTVLRIDPSQLSMEVHYLPDAPASAGEWYLRLPEAVAFVNGGFFNTNGTAQGLLVSYGRVYGETLSDYGGTFVVTETGAEVLATQNFDENISGLQHVIQGYPMLIESGDRTVSDLNSAMARRTVIGQDTDGSIIIAVTSSGEVTLDEMSSYLLCASDLGLKTAFNLDGGASSMLYTGGVAAEPPYLVRSSSDIPAVIAVYGG